MFTKCLKLTKKSAVAIIIIAGVILAAAVILCSNPRSIFSTSDMLDVSALEGRKEYLESYGWEIDPDSESCCTVILPKELDGTLADYAAMQKSQGYDFCLIRRTRMQAVYIRGHKLRGLFRNRLRCALY